MLQRHLGVCMRPVLRKTFKADACAPQCSGRSFKRINSFNNSQINRMSSTQERIADSTSAPDLGDLDDSSRLSHLELIARVNDLQVRLQDETAKVAALTARRKHNHSPATPPKRKPTKVAKPFDPSRYSTRHIALKFSYLGHRYNGYEHASGTFTPLPTIEEVLWKALRKARLINPTVAEGADGTYDVVFEEGARRARYYDPSKTKAGEEDGRVKLELSWDDCEYSKCGRTDRGVSAFGQVIGVRVRSNKPKPREVVQMRGAVVNGEDCTSQASGHAMDITNPDPTSNFDHVADELPYLSMLNTILPPDIRMLAWCPDPGENFDARFSCRERRYKYFFTNPAFCPTPGPLGLENARGEQSLVREGWLDIDTMKKAAKKLEGLHDYRNLCKIDASKQMPKCERRITFADVEEFDYNLADVTKRSELNARGETSLLAPALENAGITLKQGPKVYAFSVHGTAFLWHQVRCMVAILFLIGQGLEQTDVVDKLLDIHQTPRRPNYEMADDAPLVLWDCVFPGESSGTEDGLNWLHVGDACTIPSLSTTKGDGKFGLGGVVDDIWKQWQEAKLREAQLAGLLELAINQGDDISLTRGGLRNVSSSSRRSQRVFYGNNTARLAGDYQPLMQRPRHDTLEEQNAKYLAGKGARRSEKQTANIETDD